MIGLLPLYLLSFLLSFGICTPVCKRLIPFLRSKAAQPIYESGPAWHSVKFGTPTLGGLSFIISIMIATVISVTILFHADMTDTAFSVISIVGFAFANALVGLTDDITKLARKQNAGLSPLQKLGLQLVLAVAFLFVRAEFFGDDTVISISEFSVDLGIIYYPAAVVFLLGIINCANLTDGVDGLASGVAFSIGISLFLICAARYEDAALVAVMLAGGTLGFLIFNINPARIFMGDTGSLFLGAVAASVVFCFDNPFLSLLFGGVYVIEGCSVILQVISYKTRKKRILLMAPLHHHLEKKGFSETKICMLAIIFTLFLAVPAYMLI